MIEGFCLVNECVGHLMSFFRFVGQHLPPEIWQYFVRIFRNVFNNCRMKNNEYLLCCHRSYKMQLEIIQDWGWWYLCKSNQKTKSSNKRINQRIFQQQQEDKRNEKKISCVLLGKVIEQLSQNRQQIDPFFKLSKSEIFTRKFRLDLFLFFFSWTLADNLCPQIVLWLGLFEKIRLHLFLFRF